MATSFKNSQQVQERCGYGVGAVTISSDVIENLIKNACVGNAVDAFIADFEVLCSVGNTMIDC